MKASCLIPLLGLWLAPLAALAQPEVVNARPGREGAAIHRLEVTTGNYQTTFPVTGVPKLFYLTLHPGIQLGYERSLQIKAKHAWLLRGQAGVFYHRFIQTAVPVKVQGVYQHGIRNGRFHYEVGLGLGYLHSIPLTYVYKQKADGSYVQQYKYGRAQGVVSFSPGLSYNLDELARWQLLFRYELLLQMPFVSGFVPVLPYNSVQLGLSYKLNFEDEK